MTAPRREQSAAWQAWVFDLIPAMFVDFSFYLCLLTVQFILDSQGVGPELLGITIAVYSIIYVVGCPSLSWLLGKARRLSIFLGLLLGLASMIGFAFASGFFQYLGLLALFGIAAALYWPSFQSIIGAESTTAELPRRLTIFNYGWTSGKALGVLTAGALFQSLADKRAAFLLAVALVAASTLIFGLRFLFHTDRRKAARDPSDMTASQVREPRPDLNLFWVCALLTNFLMWGGQSAVIALIPKIGKALGMSAGTSGLLLTTMILAQTAMFTVLKSWRGWLYSWRALLIPPTATALAFLMLPAEQGLLLAMVAMVFFGASVGLSYSASIFYALDTPRPGVRAAIHEATLGGGSLLLPPLFGFGVKTLELEWSCVIFACFSVVWMIALVVLFRVRGEQSEA